MSLHSDTLSRLRNKRSALNHKWSVQSIWIDPSGAQTNDLLTALEASALTITRPRLPMCIMYFSWCCIPDEKLENRSSCVAFMYNFVLQNRQYYVLGNVKHSIFHYQSVRFFWPHWGEIKTQNAKIPIKLEMKSKDITTKSSVIENLLRIS
jgi:hypothetical protein